MRPFHCKHDMLFVGCMKTASQLHCAEREREREREREAQSVRKSEITVAADARRICKAYILAKDYMGRAARVHTDLFLQD